MKVSKKMTQKYVAVQALFFALLAFGFSPPASAQFYSELAGGTGEPEVRIWDYVAFSEFDEEFRDEGLDLSIIVESSFNVPQTVRVEFTLFAPAAGGNSPATADGKRLDGSSREQILAPNARDTVRFRTKIMGTQRLRYSSQTPHLYTLTMSVTHDGRVVDTVSVRFGFSDITFDGKQILSHGTPLKIALQNVDFSAPGTTEKSAAALLAGFKKRGVNTLEPTGEAQPTWFYDLAERLGFWLVDRAAVECDLGDGTRGPRGTKANDPTCLQWFLEREKAMFYRSRNRANVIGWSIGGDCGNGFNMYRSYLILKQLDPRRPVIYHFAGGEWNTDL